ncbi:hypothetical protein B0H13DRAFT_2300691 [Mycena leptocephala]|nr:hypothetical protein B0H13DRAFT_2300691 [Mycena leptocephala]
MSDVVFSCSSRFFAMLPMKLYRALPAVILGILFNILDTVSTGLLIFPSDDGAFKSLQLQGLSMHILSTLSSQIVMTMGGSRFPGPLGAMLIEILPFLRGIGSDIRIRCKYYQTKPDALGHTTTCTDLALAHP